MATKEDVLKVLFPNGIPVERLKDLPAILNAAQTAADVALASTPGFVIVPGPSPEPEEEHEEAVERAPRRFSEETKAKRAAATLAKVTAAIDHMMDSRKRFHPLSWLAHKYHVSYADLYNAVVSKVETGEIELYAEDGDLTRVEFIRRRAVKARRFAPGVESRAVVKESAQLSIVTSDTPIEVEDDQVQKVLQYIQDGDKTIQDVSKHFHYGQGFIEGILKTAHTKYGFQFNRDAAGTLSIAFIPPKQVAAN